LPSLGAVGLEFSPAGAVGWYFVPFLNLFRPYQVMREIHNGSDRGVWVEFGAGWRRRNAPVVVKTWWVLFLLMNFLGNALARAGLYADTPGAFKFAAVASVIDNLITIAAALAAIWLVWSVTNKQEFLADQIRVIDDSR
jgi:hypothetical protein